MSSADGEGALESYGTDIGSRSGSLDGWREWFLVDGSRLAIAFGIAALLFLLLLVLNWIGVIGFVNDDSITRMAGGMIAGSFSLVTLVVTINQMILSREFTSASEFRDRLGGIKELRRDLEELTGVAAAPTEPISLIELLAIAIDRRASTLHDASSRDDESSETITRYARGVNDSTDRFRDFLAESDVGMYETVSAMIRYDDGWQLYAARRLRNKHRDSLSETQLEALEELIDAFELFAALREKFKTTYLQRELTLFSRLTIYTGVPAVVAAILIGLLYADFGGAAIPIHYLPYVTSVLITIVAFPLALLASFILRSTTVARRTASIGPVTLQKDPDEGPFEVSYGEMG